MAAKGSLTFISYTMISQRAVNACKMDAAGKIRGKRGKLHYFAPGDYIVEELDGDIRVVNGANFEAEFTDATNPSAAPTSLAATNQVADGLRLTWTKGDAAALTEVYQDNVLIATVAANTELLDVTGLDADTTYVFKIRHSRNEEVTAYATPLTTYTRPTAPAAPTLDSKTDTTATINFTPVAGTQTQVYVDGVANGAALAVGVATKAITGLTTATLYSITLKAKGVTSTLESAASTALAVTTD